MDLRELWASITADLKRARAALPDGTDSNVGRWFQEYLDHNELELACDMLELHASEHGATREFWLCLVEAAKKMKLSDKAKRYEERAKAEH